MVKNEGENLVENNEEMEISDCTSSNKSTSSNNYIGNYEIWSSIIGHEEGKSSSDKEINETKRSKLRTRKG